MTLEWTQESVAARPRAATQAARDHFVQFYERDETLVAEVAQFLRHGVEGGAAAIMIATPEHVQAISRRWQDQHFDAAAARSRGQLTILDATATLAEFMVEGWPDAKRFEQVVGGAVRAALQRHGDLLAFGEMVALLWANRQEAAALELERLWNELSARSPLTLHCAYPISAFASTGAAAGFRHVCQAHAHVVPAETLRAAGTDAQLLQFIAELQQKAASLEREVELRKHAERMLAERERELADFVENSVLGMHRVAEDGTILWANATELRMLGYEAHEYVGRNVAEFHADRDLAARILETLARGEIIVESPARLVCKDGSMRRVLINSNARIRDGKMESTRCVTRDVTERWLAQEALRERSAVLHLAMQGARMGYWVADLREQVIHCSSELAALLGLDGPRDWSMQEFLQIVHPDDAGLVRSAVDEAAAGCTVLACNIRMQLRTGEWHRFEMRGEAICDDEGRAMRLYGICMDAASRERPAEFA